MSTPPRPEPPFRPTVGEALHHAVAHWPDHDFIVTPDRHLTYRQAEDASGHLARRMLAAGMGRGTWLGLCLPYGQEWVLVRAYGRALDPDDIARRAREQISAYEVPTRIEVWEVGDVPWLGSGKPDKRAIRERMEEPGR